jgi:magnesium-transporting ATPase (P-type)
MPTFLIRAIRLAVAIASTALKRRRTSEIFWFALLAVCALSAAWCFSLIFEPSSSPTVYPQESGPSESMQNAILILAGVLFLSAAIRFSFEIFYASAAIAVACGLAAVRELPSCDSTFYVGGPCLTGDAKILIVLAVIGLGVALLLIRREPFSRHVRELNFFWIVPCGITLVLLAAADLYGEGYNQVWLEETLELGSYLNLLVFAVVLNVRPDRFEMPRAPYWKPAPVLKERRATVGRDSGLMPSSPSGDRPSAASR